MIIKLENIESLYPCKTRLENYIKHYENKELTPRQFMGLKHITHNDKLWVAFRMMDMSLLSKCAGEIAMSARHIYEDACPWDLRPRIAIADALNCAAGSAASAAHDATAAAYECYSKFSPAVFSAAYAAAYAATVASYVAHAAKMATYAKPDSEKAIRTMILKYWKG